MYLCLDLQEVKTRWVDHAECSSKIFLLLTNESTWTTAGFILGPMALSTRAYEPEPSARRRMRGCLLKVGSHVSSSSFV